MNRETVASAAMNYMKGTPVVVAEAYYKSRTHIPDRATGHVFHVDFDGNVCVNFDEPFRIYGGEARGYTFTPEEAKRFLRPCGSAAVVAA